MPWHTTAFLTFRPLKSYSTQCAAQKKIHELITDVYESLPIPVVHVPVLKPAERTDYILNNF